MGTSMGLNNTRENWIAFEQDLIASTGYTSVGEIAMILGFKPCVEDLEFIVSQKAQDYGFNDLKELFNGMGYLQEVDMP
jgi:hypothetical protein